MSFVGRGLKVYHKEILFWDFGFVCTREGLNINFRGSPTP